MRMRLWKQKNNKMVIYSEGRNKKIVDGQQEVNRQGIEAMGRQIHDNSVETSHTINRGNRA